MNCKTKQMSSYQRLRWEMEELCKDYMELKNLVNEIDNHLWEATKTATGETREHIQRAIRAIHMYEKK